MEKAVPCRRLTETGLANDDYLVVVGMLIAVHLVCNDAVIGDLLACRCSLVPFCAVSGELSPLRRSSVKVESWELAGLHRRRRRYDRRWDLAFAVLAEGFALAGAHERKLSGIGTPGIDAGIILHHIALCAPHRVTVLLCLRMIKTDLPTYYRTSHLRVSTRTQS